MGKLPSQNGFYMPAEQERHEGTWLRWPHEKINKGYQMRLEHIWLAMTEALYQNETGHLMVIDDPSKEHIVKKEHSNLNDNMENK